jgi:hypothetical protein
MTYCIRVVSVCVELQVVEAMWGVNFLILAVLIGA